MAHYPGDLSGYPCNISPKHVTRCVYTLATFRQVNAQKKTKLPVESRCDLESRRDLMVQDSKSIVFYGAYCGENTILFWHNLFYVIHLLHCLQYRNLRWFVQSVKSVFYFAARSGRYSFFSKVIFSETCKKKKRNLIRVCRIIREISLKIGTKSSIFYIFLPFATSSLPFATFSNI